MPRRRKSPQIALPTVLPDPPQADDITLSRASFQALHSAARALFRQSMGTENHSAQTLIYLQCLDVAIDEGHEALGTQRSYADQYIHLIGGLTDVQMANAQKILEHEGLMSPMDVPGD